MCDQCNAPEHKEKSAEERAVICAEASKEAQAERLYNEWLAAKARLEPRAGYELHQELFSA